MKRWIEKGFSLIELVAAMALLAVLAGLAVPFVSNGVRAYNDTTANLQTAGKLRYASERITRELRAISNTGGVYAISTPVNISGTSITFQKTDGTVVSITGSSPNVNLAYDTLASGAYFVLSDELANILFNYYQADGVSQANSAADVAYIEFELTLDNGNTFRQRSRIALRNRF